MTHETGAPGSTPGAITRNSPNERFQPMTDATLAAAGRRPPQEAIPGFGLFAPDPGHDALVELASRMAVVANACNRQDGIDEHVAAGELANWITSIGEHFDPAVDVQLATVADQLVGYTWVDWVDTTDGLREYRIGAYVHPDWQQRGIGTALLAWGESRARAHAAVHPTERPLGFGTWASEKRERKRALITKHGYEPVRWFFEMLRTNLDEVDVPPMPEGLEVRPIANEDGALRQLFAADVEAFKDHWGGFAGDEADYREWINDPSFDPSLYVVAFDGDEIAGGVENAIYREENAAFNRSRGWLDSVFTRRPWRRRGLGAALVARSLVRLREAGMSEAMLGVDSDNPTGALGLYERAGFRVHTRSLAFRKPM